MKVNPWRQIILFITIVPVCHWMIVNIKLVPQKRFHSFSRWKQKSSLVAKTTFMQISIQSIIDYEAKTDNRFSPYAFQTLERVIGSYTDLKSY